jgi:hypothetical protein
MLYTKLVVRLLDPNSQLLGWTEVIGEARGDGKITVADPTIIHLDTKGIISTISVHWCDVNVEVRPHFEPIKQESNIGDTFSLQADWVAIDCGPAAGGLPPVTVRTPVKIEALTGALGARDPRR